MKSSHIHNNIGKISAVVAATLILPALAFAGDSQGNQNGPGQNQGNTPVVPETNAAWVLVPVLGAVLFFSSRRFLRAKTDRKNGFPS
jgi:hypothetical protein